MNDLFGAESFAQSRIREFVHGLVLRLLAHPDLVNQTRANSKKQFMESQDFQAAVTEMVVENQEAQNTMADYFFSEGPGVNAVMGRSPTPSTKPRSTRRRTTDRSSDHGIVTGRASDLALHMLDVRRRLTSAVEWSRVGRHCRFRGAQCPEGKGLGGERPDERTGR